MASIYSGSDYVRQREAASVAEFDRHMRQQKLRELFEAGALEAVELTGRDREYVKVLEEEKAAQDKIDEAFLKGFVNGGRKPT